MLNKWTSLKEAEYITFPESDAIKGVLTLLIILGHNHYLAPIGGLLFNYLYKFHVICFFILPFFYNKTNKCNFPTFRNIVVKCYVPYFFFFVLCTFIYVLTSHDSIELNLFKIFYTFFNGSQSLIKENTGFYYLWFLPAFCAFAVIKMLFDNANIYVKFFIVANSMVLILFFPIASYFILPFAIGQGLYYFSFGFITSTLIFKIPYNIKYIGAIGFVILSIIFLLKNGNIKLLSFVFPITAFMFLHSLKKIIVYIPYLQQLGKLSLPVYLVHVIVYNVLERIFAYSVLNAAITYIVTIILSVIISFLITKIPFVQKLILPKGYNDFKSLFLK